MVLHLNKLETPSPKDALCQVWLELAQWYWRRKFFNFQFIFISIYFCYFVIISPWKGAGPFIWSTWIPFTQRCFVSSLVEIGPVVLKKKMKMWKVNNNDDDNDGQMLIRKAHLSLWLRWANKNQPPICNHNSKSLQNLFFTKYGHNKVIFELLEFFINNFWIWKVPQHIVYLVQVQKLNHKEKESRKQNLLLVNTRYGQKSDCI